MDKTQVFLEYLAEEGFRATLDEDGDIRFKFEGSSYYLIVSETDEMYFQIFRNGFWRIESAEEFQRALLHANDITRDTKVAKIYINSEQTYVNGSVELFYSDIEEFKPCFMRALNVLQMAVSSFCSAMQKDIAS